MSEVKVVIRKFQGVWVASIFHGKANEHHGFQTQEEADDCQCAAICRNRLI